MGIFDRKAEPRTLVFTRLFVLVSAAVFAALVPWATTPLLPLPAFIPVYESAVVINDAITAVMLFGLFRLSRFRALWWMATAYLFNAAIAFVHMLTFPGVFSPAGLLGAGTQTTAWLFVLWHAGFPLCILFSSIRPRAPLRFAAPALTAVVLVVLLVVGALLFATSGWVPTVIQGGKINSTMVSVVSGVLVVGAGALVVLWMRRPATVFDRWLWAALLAWGFEIALSSVFNAGRYDLGFYSGRVFGIIASSIVLWVLLLENSTLYGQLEQSNLRLQESDRLKSQFLANMSHEIRTPLNAIIGLSSLELRGEASRRQRDSLVKIRDAGDTLLRLVNDILDLSKIEAGKLTFETTEFSLEKVLGGIAAMFESKASDKHIGFRIEVAPSVPRYLRGDPLRLGQVLTNLVGNAVKFTGEGQVTVDVTVVSHEDDAFVLEFVVKDSGIGMSANAVERLFSAFVQADSTISRRFGGTGLGLSIAKELAAGMGGDIRVESVPGKGSTFIVTLPVTINREKEAERRIVPEALTGLSTLLIVENPATRARLESFLTAYPFELVIAESGKEAFRQLKEPDSGFALLIVDLWLGGVSGFEILRYVKSDDTREKKPAVFIVSSLGTKAEHDEAYDSGADAFLAEPVSSSALADAIMRSFGASTPYPVPDDRPRDSAGLAGSRVLIVEDNDVNRQITSELLKTAGVVCETAESGEEAVERLMANPALYDLVLMDIQMPGMDGYAATRRLRQEPGFAELPIIALSAHAFAEERQKSLDAGMNGHVTKPIDPEALFEAVRSALKNSPMPGSALDTVSGLARVAGNKTLYRRLLASFASGWNATDAALRGALASGDRGELARIAHTVRGSAGNLGINGVADAAAALDTALHASASDDTVFSLVATLANAGTAVAGLLPRPEEPTPHDLVPQEIEVVRALKNLVADSDASALDFRDEHRAALAAAAGREWDALDKALSKFAFGDALDVLEQVLRR